MSIKIQELRQGDRADADLFITESFGYSLIVLREGETFQAKACPGFAALGEDGRITGILIYNAAGGALEILMLCASPRGHGTGTALVERIKEKAKELGCRILRVVTTNDNLEAMGFYQKKGFRLKRLYVNAMDRVREIKPDTPLFGEKGILLSDQIELEMDIG